jgi:hypothetical protein
MPNIAGWFWRKLQTWLTHPRLAVRLALIAMLLSSSALFIGIYLDDQVARYIYSDREGAERLFRNHSGGFGFALGDPIENQWLKEMGWAPWWLDLHMRFAGYRPLSVLSHRLDFGVLTDHTVAIHAHSLLWLGLMVFAVTRMYRSLMAPELAGAAALLFALDHTHGFAVGYIMNRHALIATALGAVILASHFRSRSLSTIWLGSVLFGIGLFVSELVVCVCGYVVAFELLARQDTWQRRLLSALPYVVITLCWTTWYKAAGFGASGTDFYLDPGADPLRFLRAFSVRAPLLLMGQFAAPPAETYYELPAELRVSLLAWAWLVIALVAFVMMPLLRRDRIARFWCLGMLSCLVPAAGPDANNRQLIFVSLGALGLLAQVWHLYAEQPTFKWRASFAGLFIAFRLLVSPLLMPLMTASIALVAPMNSASAAFLREPYAGRDVILVSAPYSYVVRMVQIFMRMADAPLPAHIRNLSAGSKPTTVLRTGPQTLEITFHDGLLSNPELRPDRSRTLRMPAGTTVLLEGLHVEVLADLPDAGPTRARFTFDKPLEDPSFAFYRWAEREFVPFVPPPIGQQITLPGAVLPVGFQ